MWQRKFSSPEAFVFFPYDPEKEKERKEERTAYLKTLNPIQAIAPGTNSSFSVDAPLFVDKKYTEPGSG